MNYRILGMLSVVATVVASLLIYSTTTTNAQTPVDSQTHNHNDKHSHEENGHSHQQSNGEPMNEAVAIPAPVGGPPPLPSEQPSPLTKQGSNSQLKSRTDNPADPLPTDSPPTLGSTPACQSDSYDCPNAGLSQHEGYSGVSSMSGNFRYCPSEAQEQQTRWTYSSSTQFRRWEHRNSSADCEYNTNVPRGFAQPCSIYYGSDIQEGIEHRMLHGY